MIDRAELKTHARSQLNGKWGLAVGGTLVGSLLVTVIINIISKFVGDNLPVILILQLISLLFSAIMGVGVCRFSLNYAYEGKEPAFGDVFSGFKVALKAIGLFFLMFIIMLIGMILLVVPGIIFSYMFSQAFFILADDNSKSIIQCLKESAAMMKGYKFKYFVLTLSFLGWILLGCIPFFIGLLWVMPYINVTLASFYLKVKENC